LVAGGDIDEPYRKDCRPDATILTSIIGSTKVGISTIISSPVAGRPSRRRSYASRRRPTEMPR